MDDIRDCQEIFEDYIEDLRVREKEERRSRLAKQKVEFEEWLNKQDPPLSSESSWSDFKKKFKDEEIFQKTNYDLIKDIVLDRISKLRLEKRRKEEEENKKQREKEIMLIDLFRSVMRKLAASKELPADFSKFDEELYKELKEHSGAEVVRNTFNQVTEDLEWELQCCCKSIRRMFKDSEWPSPLKDQEEKEFQYTSRSKQNRDAKEAKSIGDLLQVFQFHTVQSALNKEIERAQEIEKKKKKQKVEINTRFVEFLKSIYNTDEHLDTTYEEAKKRLGHRAAWDNVETSEERRVLFQDYMEALRVENGGKKKKKKNEEVVVVETKKRKRSGSNTGEKEKVEEKKDTVETKKRKRTESTCNEGEKEEKEVPKKKKKKEGGITWESIQEEFPKKITVAQLKTLCTEKGLDTKGKKADLMKRVKNALNKTAN